jgi:hypothetical protein
VTSFTSATKTTPQPAIFDTLAPNTTATYTVTGLHGAGQLVVVTPAGALVVLAPAC